MTTNQIPETSYPTRIRWAEHLAEGRRRFPRPENAPPGERLTEAEIKTRYPDQYVVLVDLDYIEEEEWQFRFRSAIVAAAHPDRREVAKQAAELTRLYKWWDQVHTSRLRGG